MRDYYLLGKGDLFSAFIEYARAPLEHTENLSTVRSTPRRALRHWTIEAGALMRGPRGHGAVIHAAFAHAATDANISDAELRGVCANLARDTTAGVTADLWWRLELQMSVAWPLEQIFSADRLRRYACTRCSVRRGRDHGSRFGA